MFHCWHNVATLWVMAMASCPWVLCQITSRRDPMGHQTKTVQTQSVWPDCKNFNCTFIFNFSSSKSNIIPSTWVIEWRNIDDLYKRRVKTLDLLVFAVVSSVKARPCGNPSNNREAAAALNTKEPSQRFAPLQNRRWDSPTPSPSVRRVHLQLITPQREHLNYGPMGN